MIFITTTGNVHVASWVLFLVTIPFLDLIMIHCIQENHLGKAHVTCRKMYCPNLTEPEGNDSQETFLAAILKKVFSIFGDYLFKVKRTETPLYYF